MSMYPAGANTAYAPWNEEETQEDVTCPDDDCGHVTKDALVTWSAGSGYTECEECGIGIEIEPPEPDYDRMRDLRDGR